uniref:Ig-like domain-containing protein n=1 Tax=Amphiprion percula TaxID=161767 RepID=A0A3P8SQ17_AMPPE
MMLCHSVLFILSLMAFMQGSDGSSCDEDCADKPVFSPSRLVVKYGDQASARCTACQSDCQSDQTNLDVSIGKPRKDGNIILWKVDSMTAWDPSAMCYYINDDGNMCCNHLPVTVYSPPQHVMIYPERDYGSESEGSQYSLNCMVYDVAPVENLIVTFYRKQTVLGQLRLNSTRKTPMTVSLILNTYASTEHDSDLYWCEAKLDLGPGGPQHPVVVRSRESMVMMTASGTVIQSFTFLIFCLGFLHFSCN